MKIFILEDDIMLRSLVEDYLSGAGHSVESASSGDVALETIFEDSFDLLLLDINVEGIDGLELLTELRKEKIMTPVIMITAMANSADVKIGFEAGADDYIKKPFDFDELDARIGYIKKIFHIEDRELIELGNNYLLDAHSSTLILKEREVKLTPKTVEILLYLYKHANRAVSIDELTQNLWNYENRPMAATIRSYIRTLRDHLSNLETIHGVGYVFRPL